MWVSLHNNNFFITSLAPLSLQSSKSSSHPIIQNGAGGMRVAFRRPSVRRAGRAQELASSSSSLQLLVFIFKPSCLQSFPSITVFNFLHCFWLSWKSFSPLHILPIGLRIPPGKSPPSFFLRCSVFFCLLFFCYFFGLFFLPFLVILSSPGDPKIKPKS